MRNVRLFLVLWIACTGCGSVDSVNNRGYIISQSEKEEMEVKAAAEEIH